jgi:GDP-D-mannose dehydratase
MNEEDLRHCAALMKAITGASPEECYKFADEFVEASKAEPEEDGIATIKKRKYVRKN